MASAPPGPSGASGTIATIVEPIISATSALNIDSVTAVPSSIPQPPHAPYTHPVSQPLATNISTLQSSRSIVSQLAIPTGQVTGRNCRGTQIENDYIRRERLSMGNSIALDVNTSHGNDTVILPMNEDSIQHTPTSTLPNGTPNASPGSSPAGNANQQQQNNRPDQMSVERVQMSMEREQPWSPEHPVTSARQDGIDDVMKQCDVVFQTQS